MAQAMPSDVVLSMSNSTSLILAAASSTQQSTIGLVKKAWKKPSEARRAAAPLPP